jgi:hypothetical protein
MAPEISVLIHTRDSAATIAPCLASVAWSDDVVVLDMASTDDTCAIAVAAAAEAAAEESTARMRTALLPRRSSRAAVSSPSASS